MGARLAKKKLQDSTIKATRPPTAGQLMLWDADPEHFGLRLSAGGARAWVVQKRLNGQMLRVKLGSYPSMPLVDARAKAREALAMIERGEDPRQKKRDAIDAQRNTFKAVREDFMAKHVRRQLRATTQASYKSALFCKELKEWEGRPIHTIKRADVHRLLDGILTNGNDGKGAPIRANRVRAYLSKLFSWSVSKELIEASPVDHVPRPAPEHKRDRVLEDAELLSLWSAAACYSERTVFGPLVQVLMLTGQRLNEVAGMRWDELHGLDGAEPEWRLSAERTKNKSGHVLPLPAAAARIIGAMPRKDDGPYVFSISGARPFNMFGKAKREIDEASGVAAWRLHDLRRTLASGLAGLGFPIEVTSKVLNHKSAVFSGVREVYNRYSYKPEMRRALEAWAAHVEGLATGSPPEANVVPLRA